jgi:DUF2993 family protein
MRKLLIAAAVLIVLLVAADRVSAMVAENQISNRIAAVYGLPAKPAVTIGGFPFLTQVLTGRYSRVDVSAQQVPADGVTLRDLHARFTGVHAALGDVLGHRTASITARDANGAAVVAFSQVGRRLPGKVRLRPAGKALGVSGSIRYRGARVPVSAILSVGVTGSGLAVTPVRVSTPDGLALPAGAYPARPGTVIGLGTLPLHLHLRSVQVTRSGLRIGASATDVHFART